MPPTALGHEEAHGHDKQARCHADGHRLIAHQVGDAEEDSGEDERDEVTVALPADQVQRLAEDEEDEERFRHPVPCVLDGHRMDGEGRDDERAGSSE